MKSTRKFTGILLLATIVLASLQGCGSGKNFDCEPYTALKNYTIGGEKYQFCSNPEEGTFAVLNKKCRLEKNSQARYIFENYLTEQYAQVLKRTAPTVREIEEASETIIKIIEIPTKEFGGESPTEKKEMFRNFIKTMPFAKTTYDINTISRQINIASEASRSFLKDEKLTEEEMKLTQEKVSKTVYVFLDETNQVKKYVKKIDDTWWVDVFFWFDKSLRNWDWYNTQRENIITNQLQKILFENPSTFAYNNLNG